MALHSYVQNYLHLVWGTHNHIPLINAKLKVALYQHFNENLELSNTAVYGLNFQPEHIHLLISLPSDIALANFVKNIKGESSHWINQNDIIKSKFRWQRGYGAFSVGYSYLNTVVRYIRNQDKHHAKSTFTIEYKDWIKKYGLHFDDS